MEDQNYPVSTTVTPTLNWGQDILEPRGSTWRPAKDDGSAMTLHAVKSLVKTVVKPAPEKLASCGKGRGQILHEKLQELPAIGLAAASQYVRGTEPKKKKRSVRKPCFPTKAELATQKW